MRVCSLARFGVCAAMALGVVRPARGQRSSPATAVITGVVIDDAGHPVPGVEITAPATSTVTRSDTAGEFSLAHLRGGSVDISVRRLAFQPVNFTIDIAAGDTADVRITLAVVAQQLTGTLVLASAPRRRVLDDFEARRKMGVGRFITRADIEKQNPLRMSDMFRMIPGAQVMMAENGRTTLRLSRSGLARCPPQFYVDGIQVENFSIDEMIPDDVEAVEIYAGAVGVPPEYNHIRSTSTCGTVLVWSRIPGNEGS